MFNGFLDRIKRKILIIYTIIIKKIRYKIFDITKNSFTESHNNNPFRLDFLNYNTS